MFVQEGILLNICVIAAIAFMSILLFIGLFYHMIFKPDYRPGHRSMPLIWIPCVKYIYRNTQQVPALSQIYAVQAVIGLCKVHEKQKIHSLTMGGRNFVFVYSVDLCQDILKSSNWNTKSTDYDGMKDLLLEGLQVSNGEKWLHRRKLLTPTFHMRILQDFTPLIQESSDYIVKKLKEIKNTVVEAERLMKKLCALILIRTAVGLENFLEEEIVEKLLDTYLTYDVCLRNRMNRPWLYSSAIFNLTSTSRTKKNCVKTLHDFIRKMIEEKRNNYLRRLNNNEKDDFEERFKGKQKPFMDLLLNECYKEHTLTEENILEESVLFFTAGSISLGAAVTYALYCLGLHKYVQKTVQSEIDEIVGHSNRKLTQEDLNSLTYLDCAIKESLRLFGTFFLSRKAPDNVKIGDYKIPKGSTVVVVPHLIHRDPTVYPNPEKYDPSRFFPENCVGRNPYSFLPFSAGPRNCIGQRFSILTMKLVIAAIMRCYDIEALDQVDKLYDVTALANKLYIPVRLKFSGRKNMKYEMK